jgi:fatty acid desaturase
VLTNHVGLDPDVDLMPFIFLQAPTPAVESHLRKFQHYYAWPLYSLLYVSWRFGSLQRAIDDRDWTKLVWLSFGYLWLAYLPFAVSVGSVLLGGLLVALVVTQSHEMEEMRLDDKPSNFAMTQFDGTRDIVCPDPITEYLFGGMQYQLTHHLFPTLPRYKYAKLQPLVIKWAEDNGIVYKRSGLVEVFSDHYAMLKANAKVACEEREYPAPGWSVELQTSPDRKAH